jgi:hypothetical protein
MTAAKNEPRATIRRAPVFVFNFNIVTAPILSRGQRVGTQGGQHNACLILHNNTNHTARP